MTHAELERLVARQTGESLHTIRQRGFGPTGPEPLRLRGDDEPDAGSIPDDNHQPQSRPHSP